MFYGGVSYFNVYAYRVNKLQEIVTGKILRHFKSVVCMMCVICDEAGMSLYAWTRAYVYLYMCMCYYLCICESLRYGRRLLVCSRGMAAETKA